MEAETEIFFGDSHLASVVEFFLDLYKRQLEASESAVSDILPVKSHAESPDTIYEFHVENDEKKTSRRMTIATLGEGSGSKSKCFKVAYDNLIVVKIPPSSITNFAEYIRNIRAEGRIALNLAPEIEYVAPGVTAILKKIKGFSDAEAFSPEALEKRYVKWLVKNQDYQDYLKIGESFVFFMDLSKNSFLSYVVDEMHDKRAFKNRVQEEIMEARNLLWDVLEFEGKYGGENLSIFFDMNRIYSDYETKIRKALKKYEDPVVLSPYEKQKWFLHHLAEKKMEDRKAHLPPQCAKDLSMALRMITKENKREIAAYKRAVQKYITETTFAQNRAKMSGIIINIIDLLASLKERGVAIRDLKPDNLFVVGDSERSAEDYSLGLIDFETSVSFKKTCASSPGASIPAERLKQPLLAGTPSYATPSHLFKNQVIKETLGDLTRILCLQDWQAAIGMIYNVVTGECLFKHTRRLLSKISGDAREAIRNGEPMADIFKQSSRMFWASAADEFTERTEARKERLESVEIYVPEKAQKMLLREILKEREHTVKKIRKYVLSQVMFSKNKDRKSLIRSSLEKIVRYRTKLEKGGIPETPLEIRKKIVNWLQGLEELKLQSEREERWTTLLKRSKPRTSAYELLELMFTLVLKSMYKEEWGTLSGNRQIAPPDEADDSGETTIVYEDTITFEE